jgi:hypothetical protein
VWFSLSDAVGTVAAGRVSGRPVVDRAFTKKRAFELIRRRLLHLPW